MQRSMLILSEHREPKDLSSVLLTSHLRALLSRQQSAPVSPLAATLMDLPASVANKRLTAGLTPLDATLTKNTGEGAPPVDLSTFRRSDVQTIPNPLFPFFSYSSALFCVPGKLNSFIFKRFRTLLPKHPGWGYPLIRQRAIRVLPTAGRNIPSRKDCTQ
jgi:hypothetical protein